MAVDLKTATPDTSLPTAGFLFGADSQSATDPSVYPLSALAQTLLGSTAFSGDTVTASKPLLDMAQTWNNAAVTFTADKINVTDTASDSSSLLFDRQVGGVSKFSIRKDGAAIFAANTILVPDASNTLALRNATNAQRLNIASSWTDASNLSRAFIDAGQTIANTLFLGSEHLGTGGNALTKFQMNLDGVTKLNYDISLPGGWYTPTSLMAGGSVLGSAFYGLPAASVALSNNSGTSSLTLATSSATFTQPASAPTLRTSTAYTVATLPSAASAGAGTRAYVTDATARTYDTVVAGGGANKVPVISDGTNWLIG